ncbi:mutS domain II family protein, partial [Vibrio parahaemolyticus V-223/04]
TCYKT